MIQRIQTVYLLLAIFVLALPIWLPYAAFTGEASLATYDLFGSEFHRPDGSTIVSGPVFLSLIVIVISALALLASVFLFKNRKVQLAITYSALFSELVLLGTYVLTIIQAAQGYEAMGASVQFSFGHALGILSPVLAAILTYLAARNIKKDEKLVRSADRIR